MLIINVIEKLIIRFIEKMALLEAESENSSIRQSIKELPNLENPEHFVGSYAGEDFVGEVQIFEELEAG
jgi:hypothetical protein